MTPDYWHERKQKVRSALTPPGMRLFLHRVTLQSTRKIEQTPSVRALLIPRTNDSVQLISSATLYRDNSLMSLVISFLSRSMCHNASLSYDFRRPAIHKNATAWDIFSPSFFSVYFTCILFKWKTNKHFYTDWNYSIQINK